MTDPKKITILAIESSCDDTAAAVMRRGKLLSNVTAQQVVHEKYGGVVPELASRQHQVQILPVVKRALERADVSLEQLDAVAVTAGPGLLGSLIVGTSFAKGLAMSLGVPLLPVNHMRAHVLAHFIEDPTPDLPFLCLTVSGGHTQIVKVISLHQMEVIGETMDDAAGEAFDKTGKLLGLPYPSGPVIDKFAREGSPVFSFPKPSVPGLNFSFSGLKTGIRYFLRNQVKTNPDFLDERMADICASVQKIIVDILLEKLLEAARQHGLNTLAIAGGVSANSELRNRFGSLADSGEYATYIPKFAYCTDNAAMVAMAGHFNYGIAKFAAADFSPSARMTLSE